jgi:hypothetical protein
MNKSHGHRQLSTHETSKPPRCQASERLELTYKGELMNQIGEKKQKQMDIE